MTDINEAALDAAWEVLNRHMTKINVKDALAAAIQAYEDALWQPIDNADVNCDDDMLVTDGEEMTIAWLTRYNQWVYYNETPLYDVATHWRPLPKPPKP